MDSLLPLPDVVVFHTFLAVVEAWNVHLEVVGFGLSLSCMLKVDI